MATPLGGLTVIEVSSFVAVPLCGMTLRQLGAEVILKATKVDGIYSADPHTDPSAQRYTNLSYLEVLNQGLQVMDSTAITMCMENDLPIIVFDLMHEGNIEKVVMGEEIGTLVYGR